MGMVVSNMTGVILAGGENRRMPVHKALIEIDGVSILDRALALLGEVFPRLIIVTRESALPDCASAVDRHADCDVRLIGDALDKRGPLTGIYSALLEAEDPYIFCVACDMPLLSKGLISHMASMADGYDAVVPRVHGRLESLHAVYGKAVLPVAERFLGDDRRAVHELFPKVRTLTVEVPEIARFDPQLLSFINVNTPEDVARIAVMAASGGGR